MADEGDLRAISDAVKSRDRAEALIAEHVASARARRRSWAFIASALGVTKQAAHQRYGMKVMTREPLTDAEAEKLARHYEEWLDNLDPGTVTWKYDEDALAITEALDQHDDAGKCWMFIATSIALRRCIDEAEHDP